MPAWGPQPHQLGSLTLDRGGGSFAYTLLPITTSFIFNPSDGSGSTGTYTNGNKTMTETPATDFFNSRTTIGISTGAACFLPAGQINTLGLGVGLSSVNVGAGNVINRSGSYFYNRDGTIYSNGSQVFSGAPPIAGGEQIVCAWTASDVSFYRRGDRVWSGPRTAGQVGNLFPIVTGYGFSVTIL